MTTDKIKEYMSATVYKYWTEDFLKFEYEVQKAHLLKAHHDLKKGLENGSIPKEQKYFAELQLIENLGGNLINK